MATTSDYLNQLQTDKQTLVDNLVTKGVNATSDETFTSLVPKVLDIPSNSNIKITDASYLFYNNARLNIMNELLNMCKSVTSMANMFNRCSQLTEIDLSNFDTSNVTLMNNMFYNCSNLQSVVLVGINKAYNMSNMFYGCSQLTEIDLSNFDTSTAIDMQAMFNYCSSLKSIDLSNFDTSTVTNMQAMFNYCSSLKSIDLSNFDTSITTRLDTMFANCTSLESIDLSSFDTSALSYGNLIFMSCTNLTKVVINRQDVFKMTNTNMFQNTPISSGTGYVYVPDNMVETYKSATNWSTYADQIKGMSELPTEEA